MILTFFKFCCISFFSLLTLFSIILSYSPYHESAFKQYFKNSVPKIEQFSTSTLLDQNLLDLSFPSPYNLYRLEEKSFEIPNFSQPKSKKDAKDHDFILFVPGHKGSHTQIIQFQGYLYEKFKEFIIDSFFFKFFAIDFQQTPSAFSNALLESQSEFIRVSLKYLAIKCQKKQQKITIIAHSMGGIAVLLALRNLTLQTDHHYILKNIEKVIFLNSPLGNHPVSIDFSLHDSYSKIYEFFKDKKSIGNTIFISFSGNKGDFEVNKEIARFNLNENFVEYYHFLTNDIRGVYLHLTHIETLTNPFFLFKMSEFMIDFYFNKLTRMNFNIFWYFQHLNRQIHSVKAKKLNESETFWDSLKNLTEFNVSKDICKERIGISSDFYDDNCRIFNFHEGNLRNIMIRSQEDQKKLRVYLYYLEKPQKIEKFVILAPEYKFNFFPDLNFKYFYVIPDNFVPSEGSKFKLIILKSGKSDKNYQILSELPQTIHKTIGFWDILAGTDINIDLNSNFSLNIEFQTPFFLDPLFLDFEVNFNTSKYKSSDIILMVFHWKDPEQNYTNLNEIQMLSTKNGSKVTQELNYANHKILQFLFPFQKNASATIFIKFSIIEILHYLGRNGKIEVLSMILFVTMNVLMVQLLDLGRNFEVEKFRKILWGKYGMFKCFSMLLLFFTSKNGYYTLRCYF